MNLRPLLFAAALSLAALAAPAAADPMKASVAALSLDSLKTTYLRCARASSEAVLDDATFQRCATVADELLKRGFDGDFDRMIAWWQMEKQRFAQAETETAIRR